MLFHPVKKGTGYIHMANAGHTSMLDMPALIHTVLSSKTVGVEAVWLISIKPSVLSSKTVEAI